MSFETSHNSTVCPTAELSALLDGELSSDAELRIEGHLAFCADCRNQLNEHKRLLSALNFAFEDNAVAQPPAGFSKLIIVRAESAVSGLRNQNERRTSLRILVAVSLIGMLFLVFPLLSNSSALLNLWDGMVVVMSVAARLLNDLGYGAAIIAKNISSQLSADSRIVGAIVMCALVLMLIAALRRLIFLNAKRG